MASRRIFILGATSAIAEAAARQWAREGATLFLAARNTAHLDDIAADLRLRGAPAVFTAALEAGDATRHGPLVEQAVTALGGFDGVLIAHGLLPDLTQSEQNATVAIRAFEVNATSVVSLCTHVAKVLAAQRGGCLAVISSVAGDRGRASLGVYSAAKAAVTALCSALRQRLAPLGVRVLTLKPGPIETPMTAGLQPGKLWSTPAAIAPRIVRAMERENGIVYLPGFWRWIMLVIRLIPETMFMRLNQL